MGPEPSLTGTSLMRLEPTTYASCGHSNIDDIKLRLSGFAPLLQQSKDAARIPRNLIDFTSLQELSAATYQSQLTHCRRFLWTPVVPNLVLYSRSVQPNHGPVPFVFRAERKL